MPSTITGCGSTQSPVPGMNPVLLDELAEEELLLVAVTLPELDDELFDAPPFPPVPFSTVTSVVQPACISTPSETRSALAKSSSDERRGFMIVRFMDDPP